MTDWSRIQGNVATFGGNAVVNFSFSSTILSGDIVTGSVLLNSGFTLNTVIDDKSNGYTVFDSNDNGTIYTAAFRSNTFLTNGPKTLTFTASGASSNYFVIMDEFQPPTGAIAISADGASVQVNSAGTTFPNFTTGGYDVLVYAVSFSPGGTSTHGVSFNIGTGDGTTICSEWGIRAIPAVVTMDLATQTASFYGPAFGISAGIPQPGLVFGIKGMADIEW